MQKPIIIINMQQNNKLQPKQQPNIPKKQILNPLPTHHQNNPQLTDAISILPQHYNFQIYKTLNRIESLSAELKQSTLKVALQFPQGLMLFACIISDILKEFSEGVKVEIVIMGDVTYGACCIDDLACSEMGCDLLVHYGHSCLIPVTETKGRVLYVFVEIQIDIQHFIESLCFNFGTLKEEPINIMGTIQFNNSLFLTKQKLLEKGFTNITIPQQKPRSSGEVLGCTSPILPIQALNIVIFLCDGRFHMQAAMIANPTFQFYQYNPYTRQLTQQKYDYDLMIERRKEEMKKAVTQRKRVCFIFGALGRQGNNGVLDRLIQKVEGKYQYMALIASQVNVELLTIVDVDFFVQIACPRLSIDWAYGTPKPLLTPYEFYSLMDGLTFENGYSMDYYSYNGGPWSNFYGKAPKKKIKANKNQPKVKLVLQCQAQGCNKGSCSKGKCCK